MNEQKKVLDGAEAEKNMVTREEDRIPLTPEAMEEVTGGVNPQRLPLYKKVTNSGIVSVRPKE